MNHLLTKDILAINRENGELIKLYGFNNEGDFVYEIINDYMTLDIMNDFKELLPKDILGNLLLTFKTSSGYTNLDDVLGNGNDTCRLLSSEISLPLTVRTRRFGDRMSIKGNGTKKIKDIFIDKKVKLSDRDTWPVVVDAKGVVVWLPGLKKSKYDKKKTEKYDIILRYS